MKPTRIITLLATVALSSTAFAEEEDTPVKFTDLPAAAAKSIKDAAGDATLKSLVSGDEDGTIAYEAVWDANGHQHEIAVTKTGEVLGLEEIIKIGEAPDVVSAAITKEAAGKKVLEVEKVLEKGVTTFEAEIQQDKGKVTVKFDVSGKVLERESADENKADEKKSEAKGKHETKGEEKDDDDKDGEK
jgi:hypothetical protein